MPSYRDWVEMTHGLLDLPGQVRHGPGRLYRCHMLQHAWPHLHTVLGAQCWDWARMALHRCIELVKTACNMLHNSRKCAKPC